MVPFIVVWSRNTIYVYPDTSGKKERWRFGTGFGRGKWTSQLGLYIYFVDYALVDEGGRNFIRIQMENVKFSCHSFFFCAHCRVVFSLCTSGPTDSHFISHSKLDMTGKWALPLGLLIEFIGRVGKKKNEDLELDLAGVNGLHNSDCTFTLSIILLSTRVAQLYCSCWWGWP